MKIKMSVFALLTVCSLLFGACSAPDGANSAGEGAAGQYNKITAAEALDMMTNTKGAIIVDVRTAEEYAAGNIAGSILIPNEEIGKTPPDALPDKEAVILIYCRSGNRSRQAAEKLIAMGYKNVYDFGGINEWPYGTVTPGEDETPDAGVLSSFKTSDIFGNEVSEQILKESKLSMINIWGTFCPPCIEEMPDLGKIHAEYKDKEFQVIGIVTDVLNRDGTTSQKQLELAADIADKTGADYTHLIPSDDLIASVLYQVSAVPTTIFVDSEGAQVGKAYLGARKGDDWKKIIDALLEEVG